MDYTLSNYSLFTEITLADVFQNVQKIDLKDVHVYNSQGTEVTNRGDFSDIEKNTQGNGQQSESSLRKPIEITGRRAN